jgi:GT2 family glycosyltransferase
VDGKYFFVGNDKLLVRGVTYGPFAPRGPGDDGFDPMSAERDFAQMAASGINAVRLYTVPQPWLLDLAQSHGLRLLIGLPWEQHVAFLDQPGLARSIEERIRAGVRACRAHPAVLGFSIGNEIPARIVRWHGAPRIERFLERLSWAVREEDPDALVTYVNYPSTEYLRLPAIDFLSFNVYLEQADRYDAYVARLQNLAGDRPLVMAEIGLDSERHGEEAQAKAISTQVRSSFARGAAGCFAFSWTDEWWRGGAEISDWRFGLTTRDRQPKLALSAIKQAFANAPFPRDTAWPTFTVVVCSFNGERTIAQCLDSLAHLDYPAYEVVVIDDGSTDRTAEIAQQYDVRLIRTPNEGLSAARNEGLKAARGELIAYIDDDAYADRDWLSHLAWAFKSGGYAGVGGPNVPPVDVAATAALVALAPGGPTHVLRSDEEAEHIPGCNCAFRTDALRQVSGFDGRFRIAGDDVDVCWRLHREGLSLGFSPGAVVWHRPRGSIRAYLRQQRGYGRAEGLLERKWPSRYNALGHVSWPGQLYGQSARGSALPGARRYEGTWGTADYQSLYQPAGALAWVPLMPEWFLLLIAVGLIGLLGAAWAPLLVALPIALAGFVLSAFFAFAYAFSAGRQARFDRRRRLRRVGLLALLFLFQPIARLVGRVERGLTPWRHRGPHVLAFPRLYQTSVWSEEWHSLASRLQEIEGSIERTGASVRRGGPFDRWDLEVRTGPLAGARLRSTSEEHDAGRQLVRYRLWPRLSWLGPLLAGGFITLSVAAADAHASVPAAVFAVMSIVLVARQLLDAATASSISLRAVEPSSHVDRALGAPNTRSRDRIQSAATGGER